MRVDQFRLRRRIQGISKIKDERKQQDVLAMLAREVAASCERRRQRQQGIPAIRYPEELPVSQKREAIRDAIENHQVVIVAGETGSGKTTQLPKICMELGRGINGLIGHSQPRRLAARSVATRIAEELGSELGQLVGYKVRFTDKVSDKSYVKLMTDGILLAEIQNDRFLNQYDTLIIDEAHERSLNIDFILGYLKQLLPKRPDLKVIITSATIDPERFSRHFSDAPIIEVSGRTYPVEVRYRPVADEDDPERDQLQAIFDAVDELCQAGPGDILVFMNGEREIRDTADALNRRQLRGVEVLPLFARLSSAEQQRIFQSHSGRRIVLATNVAETSLTVPGIRYVIDPGTARISRYSYRTKVQRLPIEPVSQASANQRKGRCGRVAAGICIRLYSEEDFLGRPEFTDPEILRTNLASVILQMLALGLGDMSRFPFVEAPDSRQINDGMRLLEELGAIEQQGRHQGLRMTRLGQQLSRLPVDPRLGRMVLAARDRGCLHEVMVITSALSIQDPRERPLDKQQAADEKHRRFFDEESDFMAFVNLWNYSREQLKALSRTQWRKLCKKDFLSYLRMREWQDIYSQLRQVIDELGLTVNQEPADSVSIHQALLAGLLSHAGFKQDDRSYLGARNSKFWIFPGSGLFKKSPKWVMAAELVETTRLYSRVVAKIQPEWIEPLAQHLIKRSYSDPRWEKRKGCVMANEQQALYGLVVVPKRAVHYGPIAAAESREIFIRRALVDGEFNTRHRFFFHNRKLLAEVADLEHKSRRRDILVDEELLFDFYSERIPEGIYSQVLFDQWWKQAQRKTPELLHYQKQQLMKHGAESVTARDFPDVWTQGNLRLPLSYQFEPGKEADGVTVSIPLAVLNQVQEKGFDWQIPGLRHELIVALIKSLPKPLRRNFVPAPNYAEATLAAMEPLQGELTAALAKQLLRMSGVRISEDSWDWTLVPEHLKMNFRVLDKNGKRQAEDRDLGNLKQQLSGEVQQTLSDVADNSLEQKGLTNWSFGRLPDVVTERQAGYEIKAYPALIAGKGQVAIELMDSPTKAAAQSRAGLRQLLLLQIPSPVKYLQEKLPNKAKLGLYFTPYGKVADVVDDCIQAGLDKLIDQWGQQQQGQVSELPVRDEAGFQALKNYVSAELGDCVVEIAKQVEQVLTRAYQLSKRLKGKLGLDMVMAHGDIKAQIEALVHKGFVTESGWQRLTDMNRYFQALEKRLEKLAIDPHRDRLNMQSIHNVQDEYLKRRKLVPRGEPLPKELVELRWMLEELRVSLFAQTLGTKYPISEKRIRNFIQGLDEADKI